MIKYIREYETNRMRFSIALDPGNLNERLKMQQGKFTLSGGKIYFNETIEKGEDKYQKPLCLKEQANIIMKDKKDCFLKCIVIDKTARKTIREQLRVILRIDRSHMMVDLDSHAQVSRDLYSFTRKR